jgi:hypothetical protein
MSATISLAGDWHQLFLALVWRCLCPASKLGMKGAHDDVEICVKIVMFGIAG